jgi:hypothetical protein
VLDVTSTSYLTQLPVDELILQETTVYYWRVAFYDNHKTPSVWSETTSLATDVDPGDQTGDVAGVPDEDEVDAGDDLDGDGVPDNEQTDIKSVKSKNSENEIGLKNPLIRAVKPLDANDDDYADDGKPEELPYGLIAFALLVEKAGDEASVEVYLSEPAAEEMIWWKFDKMKGGWYDYAGYHGDDSLVVFSSDRRKVTLKLKDGGYGDSDGVANGRIVDPSGLGTGHAEAVEETDTVEAEEEDVANAADTGGNPGAVDSGGGGGGGGCFIDSLTNSLF